jgi:hypothetical protein
MSSQSQNKNENGDINQNKGENNNNKLIKLRFIKNDIIQETINILKAVNREPLETQKSFSAILA